MFDLIAKRRNERSFFQKGSYVVMGSVGAGMNINCIVYKMPNQNFETKYTKTSTTLLVGFFMKNIYENKFYNITLRYFSLSKYIFLSND